MRNEFNFDEMVELYQRSPEMFEQRRNELLLAARERCSGPQREALDNLQYELDQVRSKQPEHFIQVCFEGMVENLGKMASAWKDLATMVNDL